MQRNLDYVSAHTFVDDYKGPNDVYWEGWNICIFSKNPRAARHPKGSFRNGKWGFTSTFAANSAGVWRVDLPR